MAKKVDIKTVGVELAKTVGGFAVGRIAVVQGEKILKVHEETDAKKKKFKEVGVGVGVAAVGTAITMKAPNDYKSVGAGMATAGVIAAVSPFGKEDAGFIPVLHGYDNEGNLVEIESGMELNAVESDTERAEREYKEFLEEEIEDNDALSTLESTDELTEDETFKLNGTIESLN